MVPLRIVFLLPVLATAALQGLRDYHVLIRGPTAWNWVAVVLTSGICAYQAILALAYAFTKDIPRHATLTFHLFIIATTLFLHVYITTLGQYLVDNSHVILTWVEYTLFVLTLGQIIAVGSIPCEPERYADLKKVYTKAVAAAIEKGEMTRVANELVDPDATQANMVSEYSSSIFSRMILGWLLPVISKMSKLDQADIQDLPGLHHFLRVQDAAREVNAYTGPKISAKRWGVTKAFLWEVWAPQWRPALQSEYCAPREPYITDFQAN